MSQHKSPLKEFCVLFWDGIKGLAGDSKGFCGAMWGIILLFPLYATAILCYVLLAGYTIEILYGKITELIGTGVGVSDKDISNWLVCAITTALVHGMIIMTKKDKELNASQEDDVKDENLKEQIKE